MNEAWLKKYFKLYKKPLFDETVFRQLLMLKENLERVNDNNGKTIIMGNGASNHS